LCLGSKRELDARKEPGYYKGNCCSISALPLYKEARMSLPKPNRSQLTIGIAIVIALAIAGGIAWGFGQQLVLARQMRAEEVRLEQAVAAEQARHDALVEMLEYVKSDEYVEHWARKEAKMARPGEVAVVPLTGMEEEPNIDAQSAEPLASESRPFWVEWWELVFNPTGP